MRDREQQRDGYIMERVINCAKNCNAMDDEDYDVGPKLDNDDDEEEDWPGITLADDPKPNSMEKVTFADDVENKKCETSSTGILKEAHPLINKRKQERTTNSNKPTRTDIIFTLPDGHGNDIPYLGLVDTGSTHSLLGKELVTKHGLPTEEDNGTWSTNNGVFKTSVLATAADITLPQFSNKRRIGKTKLSVNPNGS